MPDPAPITEGQPKGDAGQPITASWRDALPEEHRTAETLKKFEGKDWTEVGPKLAVSYINLEKMPRGVTIPKDDAPQAEKEAFWEKLGRPKTADEYGIELKVPEGLTWNKAAEKLILGKAHARGLTRSQAEGLLNDYLAIAQEGNSRLKAGQAADAEAAYAEIQKDWGGVTERNLALVQRCVGEFGGEDLKTYLDESGLGNDPRFLKFVHKMGAGMVEGNLIRGENLGVKSADAKAEIAKLMATKEWASGDKATLQRINDLYPLAHAS